MYSTCLFCHADLGANREVEAFPVGSRLAFDAAKGRLWVVCPGCGRWNLSSLEERWEAVEACERLFRESPLRVSTENVGLARLRDGTDLVRIGAPRRPEMAAWRYGRELARRRRHAWITGAAAVAGGVLLLPLGPLLLPLATVASAVLDLRPGRGPTLRGMQQLLEGREAERFLAQLPPVTRAEAGEGRRDVAEVKLRPDDSDAGWALHLRTLPHTPLLLRSRSDTLLPRAGDGGVRLVVPGREAGRALAFLLAGVNRSGASGREVRRAVAELEDAGGPEALLAGAEARAGRHGAGYRNVWSLPSELRLAAEMAVHEEDERRAMEGELAGLEARWREAERIAAIADRLAVSPEVEAKLERMRGGGRPASSGDAASG